MKETEDYYSQNRQDVACLIEDNIQKILDIGCGEGYFLKNIKETRGSETWGIELDPEIGERAKKNVDHVLIGSVESTLSQIPDNYFDCISFNDVLEHLYNPQDVLTLIAPKLLSSGFIIASIPNVRYFHNLKELLISKDWEYKDSGILDSTHVRFFTKRSMKRMFEKAGYRVVKMEGINALDSWKFKIFNALTFGYFDDSKYFRFVCIVKK